MSKQEYLLINMSPRKKGTSASFLRTLLRLALEKGSAAEIVHAIDYFDGRADIADLAPVIARCDTLVLSAPLYVDGLPYPGIWFLEKLYDGFSDTLIGKGLFALGQGGFPHAELLEPLLGQCRIFAVQAGMRWYGGLGHGGGAIIDGQPLESLGKKGKRLTAALGLALEAAAAGQAIPDKAKGLFATKLPRPFLRLIAAHLNRKAKKTAARLGADFARRPYLESADGQAEQDRHFEIGV